MAKADINALKSMKEGFCSISALLATPSAGKSGAMSLIKSKVISIDIFNGTKVDETQICNAATCEGLIAAMKKYGNLIIKNT